MSELSPWPAWAMLQLQRLDSSATGRQKQTKHLLTQFSQTSQSITIKIKIKFSHPFSIQPNQLQQLGHP